jgi:hypothetical protein
MAYFPTYLVKDAAAAVPVISRIEVRAIRDVLEEGLSDFCAMPSHAAFLALVYPLCGMVLAYAPAYQNALQLLFPLASVCAGRSFAAVGLYEMTGRRELASNSPGSMPLTCCALLDSLDRGARGAPATIFAAWITSSRSTRRCTPRRQSFLSTSSSKSLRRARLLCQRWLFHRLLLCRRNASRQRRFVSSAPRPRRRRYHRSRLPRVGAGRRWRSGASLWRRRY